jgi:anaphase-promoting complex subunit 4
VYIYRVILDCENGVSSTRRTGIGAVDLQEGEIRQIQFVEDDTIMLLWSNNGMFTLPYRPSLGHIGLANTSS